MMTTIGGLAEACGVGVETVRYYQRRGLMETPARGSGVRRYGMEAVRRLRFIRQAPAAGFSLDEIPELIALESGRDSALARTLAGDTNGSHEPDIAKLTVERAGM